MGPNLEACIAKHSELMATGFPAIANDAGNEEEVRHGCTRMIDAFLVDAGIDVARRLEYALAGGFIDSLYGGVIIEYKDPHGGERLSARAKAAGNNRVIRQISQRFEDFANVERVDPARLFGVGCDGVHIIFVRSRGGDLTVDAGLPVNVATMERFLRSLASLGAQGRAYTAINLLRSFGPTTNLARDGIKALSHAIASTDDPKAKVLFEQWQVLFSEVCGFGETLPDSISELMSQFNVSSAIPRANLLFAVHTYYAIFTKILASEILASISPDPSNLVRRMNEAETDEDLQGAMTDLEDGAIWGQLQVSNFLEGNMFSWYLDTWSDEVARVARGMAEAFDNFDPSTLSLDPAENRDLLRRLYHGLLPPKLRKSLGEYYTPDWLADFVLDELKYDGNPDVRLVDPACGSGTFIVAALRRANKWFRDNRDTCGFGQKVFLQKLLSNIVGFDLNPLAVLSARTNYLLSVRHLVSFEEDIELPLYLCDALTTAHMYRELPEGSLDSTIKLRTSVGELAIPTDVSLRQTDFVRYTHVLEDALRLGCPPGEFVPKLRENDFEVRPAYVEDHQRLFSRLSQLHAEGRNGIWARLIKNAFAPLFLAPVDLVVGNPPWINWEQLPSAYRDETQTLWDRYDLRPERGQQGRMQSGRRDICTLFCSVALDRYLKPTGRLGFVLTAAVFRSLGAARGFRRFRFREEGGTVYIKPQRVHDFGDMGIFDKVSNKTCVMLAKRQKSKFKYPVPYVKWTGVKRMPGDISVEAAKKRMTRELMAAQPVDPEDALSAWLAASTGALRGLAKVIGMSHYTARQGVNAGGLSGCYWVTPIKKVGKKHTLIANLHDAGKKKVPQIRLKVENAMLWPLLRGKDVTKWNGEPSCLIVAPQDIGGEERSGIPESKMRTTYPKTLEYLSKFKGKLEARADRKYYPEGSPYYTMRNMAHYALTDWKVVWNRVDQNVRAVVVGRADGRPILCQETHTYVPFETKAEAMFFCGMINSSIVNLLVRSYSSGKSFAPPQIMKVVKIPEYEPKNKAHTAVRDCAKNLHSATDTVAASKLMRNLDCKVGLVWGLTKKEILAAAEAVPDVV